MLPRLLILVPLLPLLLRAGEEAAFFETRVRPLLAEHCLKCHGEKDAKGSNEGIARLAF